MIREYLTKLRISKGLTKLKTAKSMEIGASYYLAIENGTRQRQMSYSMMVKLADAFEVPVQTIIDAEAAYIAQIKDSA